MIVRFRRFRQVYRLLPRVHPGYPHGLCLRGINLFASYEKSSCNVRTDVCRKVEWRLLHSIRYSTVSEIKQEEPLAVEFLSFIRSSLTQPEGHSHRWLNKAEDGKRFFKENGVFLVVAGEFSGDSLVFQLDTAIMFEKAKSLQQRYPFLQILAFLYSRSICLDDIPIHLLWRIMKEYITFPILLSRESIFKIADGPCYIIFKDFKKPLIYFEKDLDLMVLDKAISDLNVQGDEQRVLHVMKSPWTKTTEVVKEPCLSTAFQNLFLSFPVCISSEESGEHMFISDVNHHRIIVTNSNGKILDVIGSSPGFEDGEFETARLTRPAASFYDATEDCLYFVDSENHAIRRADMERRVVDTVYPVSDASKKSNGLWRLILDRIWTKRNVDAKPEEFTSKSFLFPWHLIRSLDNDLIVLNSSFSTLWIIDLASGSIRETVKDFPKIWEICGQMIEEKLLPLKQIPDDWLNLQAGANYVVDKNPYAALMSSVTTSQGHVVVCDAVGQMVFKFSKESGTATSFRFSNFGILGLPYWLSFPLERVYASGYVLSRMHIDHIECLNLLPGRVEIELNIDIPQHTDLVETLEEGCIWRQARGAATEVSGAENRGESSEKVGVAQQWYDEIDNLSFSAPEIESATEETNKHLDEQIQKGKIRIGCTVNTSPGTSEVIIYAALYLRLKRNQSLDKETQKNKAAIIADILNTAKKVRTDLLVKLLLASNSDLGELIFIRPLHVKLKFDTRNHPKADNSKDIILTESSVKVHVAL